ncbi:hypothetical protein KJ365_09825 [Glaciecola sp. XM2]|jgi:guanylate kinase|nr:hypothetical protein [Glaciecola sp. XM2]
MRQAVSEMSHYREFDYVIVNDDFHLALRDLISIVNSQTLTLGNQSARHSELLKQLLAP